MRGSSAGLGRWLLVSVGVTVVAALCVAAILLAGSRPEEASKTSGAKDDGLRRSDLAPAQEPTMMDGHHVLTDNEALVQDARSYARDMDVPLKEAIRHLQMQGGPLVSDLEHKLRRTERDAYAGLWLRHKPDYGITVALAGDSGAAAERVRRFVEGTQSEGAVDIKRVEASMVELNAARARAEEMFDRLGITYSSGDNVFKNRMEIYVADASRAHRKLRVAGLKLPEHVVVMEGMDFPAVPE